MLNAMRDMRTVLSRLNDIIGEFSSGRLGANVHFGNSCTVCLGWKFGFGIRVKASGSDAGPPQPALSGVPRGDQK
jgi:hypothetical protein